MAFNYPGKFAVAYISRCSSYNCIPSVFSPVPEGASTSEQAIISFYVFSLLFRSLVLWIPFSLSQIPCVHSSDDLAASEVTGIVLCVVGAILLISFISAAYFAFRNARRRALQTPGGWRAPTSLFGAHFRAGGGDGGQPTVSFFHAGQQAVSNQTSDATGATRPPSHRPSHQPPLPPSNQADGGWSGFPDDDGSIFSGSGDHQSNDDARSSPSTRASSPGFARRKSRHSDSDHSSLGSESNPIVSFPKDDYEEITPREAVQAEVGK